MIVCSCNALRERDISPHVCEADIDVPTVYKRCGTRPKCGRCMATIAEMIDAARSRDDDVLLAAE